MKITGVHVSAEYLPLTRPYTISYRTTSAVTNLIVRLETDQGLLGFGAGSPAKYVTGEELDVSLQKLQDVLPDLLTGQDPRQLGTLLYQLDEKFVGLPAAKAASDIALHDLFGKILDQPVVRVLGGDPAIARRGILTSITIGIKDTLEEALEEAKEYTDRGFKILKIKTGKSVDQDIEVVRKLHEATPSDVALRVDANQGYTTDDLAKFLQKTADYGVEFVEQPLKKGAWEKLRKLDDSIRAKLCADEDLQLPSHAVAMAAPPRPYGIYNIKLMKCGGMANALRIARTAETADRKLMWGCMDESIISIAGALHAALASPATKYLDLDGSLDLAKDLVEGGFRIEDGRMFPLNQPGLGITWL